MLGNRACCTQFWLRKLHSFTGFAFLGYFLCLHVRGEGAYESTLLRTFFLWFPLLFHGLYGLITFWKTLPCISKPLYRDSSRILIQTASFATESMAHVLPENNSAIPLTFFAAFLDFSSLWMGS